MQNLANRPSYVDTARELVFNYILENPDKTDGFAKFFEDDKFTPDDVFAVWFSKTLLNWKACVSTTIPNGIYYEVTFNGNNGQTYIDVYKKIENVVVTGDK
jgi:hypothetical protein